MLQPNFELLWEQNKKKLNPKDFLQNGKQEFPGQSLESFSRKYCNMENPWLSVWTCVHQTSLPKLKCWKSITDPAWQIEYTIMVQPWKIRKDANQFRMHVLSWNSDILGISFKL